MKKVLIIEDDKSIAELEHDYIEISGFECDVCERGDSGLKMALDNEYDLLVIDIMLPGLDGFEILSELRKKKQTPVIFLSARSDDIDKIRGLGMGADDYMTKPFSPNELVARVKAHIARHETLTNTSGRKLVFDKLEIDRDARIVKYDSKEVTMTAKEFDLLLFLAENPNRTFTKDHLFDRIWGMDAIGDVSTVTVHIQRIREKINREHIETVWGVGYRFKK